MKRKISLLVLTAIFLAFACGVNVNKSITIKDGETVRKSLNVINGIIKIGNDCKIEGEVRTVNGAIWIGDRTEAKGVESVNGQISIGDSCYIRNTVKVVNGSISCGKGTEIRGSVKTLNGNISLTGVYVRDNVATINGNIKLEKGTIVDRDIVIKNNDGKFDEEFERKIFIRDSSVVRGDILVDDERLNVVVYLENGGKVLGRVKNAEIISD